MHTVYTATVFAGALVCLLASLLLFVRRNAGGRARIILAVIVSFSVYNYLTRFVDLCHGNEPDLVVSPSVLLQANFMVLSYILYPIEVISPGWLTFRRLLALFTLWLVLLCVYRISIGAGVTYTPYYSLSEMMGEGPRFEVWFRLLLAILIFSPVLAVFFVHRTRLYRNSDRAWLQKYLTAFLTNIIAYVLVLTFDHPLFHTLYYYISVGCSLYIAYMELFDRLTGKSTTAIHPEKAETPTEDAPTDRDDLHPKKAELIRRLNTYMERHCAWRNPDLSLNALASELFTNRTTLTQAIQASGYDNYTHYINRLRIDDFVKQIHSGQSDNFQEAFFAAGFRSRGTALRHFRQYMGTTPSLYFQTRSREDSFIDR